MKKINVLQKTFLLLSILYLSLFIPTLITTYSSKWYEYNYDITNIKNNFPKDEYKDHIQNLISFMAHQSELNKNWSNKEKEHYSDVQNLFHIGLLLASVSIAIIALLSKQNIRFVPIAAITNIIIISFTSVFILPFFEYFWDNIFHQLFFDNMKYQMEPEDLSYYLFPLQFFLNTTIFIISSSIIINSSIYTFFKTQKLIKSHQFKKNKNK